MQHISNRKHSFDFVKGILIILVIAGHILQGSLDDSLVRYFIYSFHMPLFFCVSGYLLNVPKMQEQKILHLIIGWWDRLICPWLIAVTFYYVALYVFGTETISFFTLFKSFIYPWYHLWFVVAYLFYVLLYYSCVNFFGFKAKTILAFAFIVSVCSSYIANCVDVQNWLLAVVQYDLRLYNLFFFVLGIYMREEKKKEYNIAVILISLCLSGCCYFINHGTFALVGIVAYFVWNVSICCIIVSLSTRDCLPRSWHLEFIGQHSYAYYLWHIAVKLILSACIESTSMFYLCSIFGFLIFHFFIIVSSKNHIISRFLFGEIQRERQIL